MAKKKDVDKDKEIFETLRLESLGLSNKEIAEVMKVSESTVSRRLSEGRAIVQGIIQKDADREGNVPANPEKQTFSLVPPANAFYAIDSFQEISRIGASGGAITGLTLANLREGFFNESLSDEERLVKASKGASALADALLGAMITYNKLTEDYGGNNSDRQS